MQQHTPYRGLSDAEVLESRSTNGYNILTPTVKEPVWLLLLKKFTDPLIIILVAAGFLSLGISLYEFWAFDADATIFFEPTGIFAAVILATGLAFIFEWRAEKEFSILNAVNDDQHVKVIRNGATTTVPRKEVVIGDIIIIDTGDEIPADGQLLTATALSVDESTLTGEPLCSKTVDAAQFDPEATFPSDRVLRGTRVMEGHGVMCADAVGDSTENGKVFKAAQIDTGIKTPLDEQLERLGQLITRIGYSLAAVIVVVRTVLYFTNASFEWLSFATEALHTLMLAVTLVVVAVPEGLPMAVTLSLAYSMRRMLKANLLVRKMHACETMGAVTVICTDKTGTLTQNLMRVSETEFYLPDDESTSAVLIRESIAANATAELDVSGERPTVLGNPTEGALLLWLWQHGVDYRTVQSEVEQSEQLPFSTERKYMGTVVYSTALGKRILYVKGAPEIVLSLCSEVGGGVTEEELRQKLLDYQNRAMRTLAFAYRILEGNEKPIAEGKIAIDGLCFMGIAAISDPVRKEVPAAVNECIDAGIGIKIVTGDTSPTACEIGRQIGLNVACGDSSVITGVEFAALSDEELTARIGELKIISRARPMDKKRLIDSLRAAGEVVAVTGDGTNDAPALKAAHVGLSMGDGTSVAKEASAITIVDNSFGSISRAVMWGRSLYRNIQRFILFQLTVNVVACLTVLSGAFWGAESPLTITQVLWVNLIMDTFAAVALASLPPSQRVMRERPRKRNAFIISRDMMLNIIGTGAVFTAILLVLLYVFRHADIHSLSDIATLQMQSASGHITLYEASLFFTTFVMLQFWNMFNARAFSTQRSALHLKGCRGFVLISLLVIAGQAAIVTLGGQMFGVTPLHAEDWAIIIVATSPVLWLGELLRATNRLRRR